MATGLKFHTRRNAASGRRWKSVYTPDVLAVGEGPSSWGDFFSQQMRWSRGTFEVLLKEMIFRLPRLSPGRALHYILITTFYPSMAIGWVLGAVNACLFLALGVQGVVVPVQLWLALYIDATAFQLWVYLRNRRYNVSPYEPEGSSGIKGMLMSIFAAPIFAASLIATILRLPAKFVVTPKGLSSSADHILTFRRHLQWAALLIGAIVLAIVQGYAAPGRAAVARRGAGRLPRAARALPGRAHRRAPAGHRRRAARRAARRPLGHHHRVPRARRARRPARGRHRHPPLAPSGGRARRRRGARGGPHRGRLRGRPARRLGPHRLARRSRPPGRGRRRPEADPARRTPGPAQPGPARPDARTGSAAHPGPSPRPRRHPRRGPDAVAGAAVAAHAGSGRQPGQPGPQGQPGQPPRPGPHPGPQAPQGPPRPAGPPPGPSAVPPGARPPGGAPGPRPRPTPRPAPSPFPAPPVRPGERPAAAEHGGRYVAPAAEHQGAVPPPPAPRPDGRPGETPVGRPTPPSPAPRPDAAPGRGPERTPRPGPRRERPPMLFSTPAELEAEGTEAVMPVSVGSSIGNETAKRHDGRDGGSRAPDTGSVNAPTVAVRVVALAAVAGPARQGPAGVPPDIEGRRTEAS